VHTWLSWVLRSSESVCGLVTLGVWWLLDGLGALGVLGELLEIVGASRKAWCTRFETHRSGDGERYS
jgi:hypothetical protein